MTDWPELRSLIARCRVAELADALEGLSRDERRALVDPLRAYAKQSVGSPMRWVEGPALAVAGAGVLSGAAAMASWQTRFLFPSWDRDTHQRIDPVGPVLRLLGAREVDWLPDLARRLAERMRARSVNATVGELVLELVVLTGMAPPATDGFVAYWATSPRNNEIRLAQCRAQPGWAALVPRMFEVDAAMVALDRDTPYQPNSWPALFLALIEEGLLDRAVLLDACVGGLQRSTRLGALRGGLKTYRALAVTRDEVAAHTRDLVALLPAAHSTVAGLAQEELRALDESSPLPVELMTEIGAAVLLRPEKKLVRAQLDWLAAVVRRAPEHADEIAGTMSVAFGHPSVDLQQRALTAMLRFATRLGQETTAELAAAAALLPADLRDRAASVFGPVSSVESAPTGPPLVPAPRELPPLIDSAAELAAEIGSLVAGLADDADPVGLERVLAGLVRISYTDRAGLHEVLRPQVARNHSIVGIPQRPLSPSASGRRYANEYSEFAAIIVAVLAAPVAAPGAPFPLDAVREREELLDTGSLPGPQRAMTRRLHEIAVGVNRAPRPLLLATPTSVTGLIAPAELVRRVRLAADEGWEPWPLDLEQALLRLPRTPDPAAAARAAEIGTPAGALLAQRLAAGNAVDPPVTTRLFTGEERRWGWGAETVAYQRMLAEVRLCSPAVAGDPAEFVGALSEPQRWSFGYEREVRMLSCWPMLLPAHREVLAVHLMPQLFERTRSGRGAGALLIALAEADGPVGPAMGLAMTYGLAAREPADRAAAVDALLLLAGRGQLDGAVFGPNFGRLVGRGELPLNRVVPALREVANAGAGPQVWALLAEGLPYALPPAADKVANRLGDLLALGVELAGQTGDRKPRPELDSLADRRGSSQLLVQARRLREVLAG